MMRSQILIVLNMIVLVHLTIIEDNDEWTDDFHIKDIDHHNSKRRVDTSDDHEVTVTAKFWYVSDFKEKDAEGIAEKYVKEMNYALKRSKIPINYKKWGFAEKLPITHGQFEEGKGVLERHLTFLNSLGDNEEGRKRLKETADMMVIMVNKMNKPYACLGFGPWERKYTEEYNTFSVTYDSPGLFIHEAGHCLGAMHDRKSMGHVGKNPDRYNYGYCLPNSKYATVMAYTYNCPDPATKRILHYSNPDVSYEGIPTGDEQNNNARAITEYRDYNSKIGSNCEVRDEKGNVENRCRNTEWTAWTEWSDCCCLNWQYAWQHCPRQCDNYYCYWPWKRQKRTRSRECLNGLNEKISKYYCDGKGFEFEQKECECDKYTDPIPETATANRAVLKCCQKKKVGSSTYTLLGFNDTSSFGCADNCVYSKDSEVDSRYCFSTEGDGLQPESCVASEQDNDD